MFGSDWPSGSVDLRLRRQREMEVRGDEVVELEKARGRQHVVGEVGGVGLKQIDRDGEEVASTERRVQPRLLRVRRGDVDVPAEERLRACGILERGCEIHVADRGR
jgi:hypothetical protein